MPGASDENVYALMQKQEMADSDTTFEEEQARIKDRAPTLVAAIPPKLPAGGPGSA